MERKKKEEIQENTCNQVEALKELNISKNGLP